MRATYIIGGKKASVIKYRKQEGSKAVPIESGSIEVMFGRVYARYSL